MTAFADVLASSIKLPLLRTTIAVKTQWLIPFASVLTLRLSLQRVSLHGGITVPAACMFEAADLDFEVCNDVDEAGIGALQLRHFCLKPLQPKVQFELMLDI